MLPLTVLLTNSYEKKKDKKKEKRFSSYLKSFIRQIDTWIQQTTNLKKSKSDSTQMFFWAVILLYFLLICRRVKGNTLFFRNFAENKFLPKIGLFKFCKDILTFYEERLFLKINRQPWEIPKHLTVDHQRYLHTKISCAEGYGAPTVRRKKIFWLFKYMIFVNWTKKCYYSVPDRCLVSV